jgi:hypothetical protein
MKLAKLSLVALLALAAPFAVGCSSADGPSSDVETDDDNEIVNVAQTDVERQSIGNCWLYAHATWIESMNLTATGKAFDTSQSYWTYWHWFDQIAGGFTTEISTGGNWSTANNIIRKYGLMSEKDFVATDTTNEMSARQKSALDAMNASLKTGALKDSASRRNKALVRREMDKAWGLTPQVSTMLDNVFGASATRTFASTRPASNTGTTILRGQDFPVSYPSAPGGVAQKKTLSQAIVEWRQVFYSTFDKRPFLLRVQNALHAAQPVIITWFVDFNALENRDNARKGSFSLTTLKEFGAGNQGGHMTVLEDYQAKLPDGRLLEAGKTLDPKKPADAALLRSALDPKTDIQFLRVKNSWGGARPDRAFAPGMPGYHDLYLDYLNGPVKRCGEKDGHTDTTNCTSDHTPLQNVVLPPGF